MRAQIIEAFGGPEVFQLKDVPDPTPGPSQVLIRQQGSSVNPVDYKLRSDGRDIAPEFPGILGFDVSGIVTAIGPDVTDFAVGDAVYGAAGGVKGQGGAYAELIAAETRVIAKRPSNISPVEAAAMPLVTITAWEGLERAGLSESRGAEKTVLVRGGTGGVGHIAIQLAKAWGAEVTASVSGDDKAKIARDLGADHIINYRDEDWDEAVAKLTDGAGFDIVFDGTGGDQLDPAFSAARLNGHVVALVSLFTHDLSLLHARGLSLHLVFMPLNLLAGIGGAEHQRILTGATALVEAGKLKPLIDDQRFTLETVPEAQTHAENGRPLGKVVIAIAD
ncbi:MAG: zinc-dependent alcohol dehydrogenase family protein [Alphaproteobacteria bacterium]|nr:zinc-dependent alcohol dehydrogenase family protein [Alphaproteobacteria bacterium SS10]